MSSKKEFTVRPFDKLKKTIEQRQAVVVRTPQQRKKKKEFTDEELFGCEMNDVLEIEEFRSLACAPRKRKMTTTLLSRGPDQEVLAALGEIAAGERPIHLPDTQEYVEWIDPAFREDIIGRLHEGEFSVQAFFDLHGCTVPEAEDELDDFIKDSLKKGLRCIKIIHGRGLRSVRGARLKDVVVARISGHFRRNVIGYVTARQCDGGLGALYVLLRKR